MEVAHMRWIALAPLVLGCAAEHKYLAPELFRRHENTLYLCCLEQDEVYLQSHYLSGGAQSTGPGGVTTFSPVSASELRREVEPLRQALLGIDFRAQLERELRRAAEASPWLVPGEVRLSRERLMGGRTGAEAGLPALVLSTSYFLARDALGLLVSTEAKLYLQDTLRPDYRGRFTYHSTGALDLAGEGALAGEAPGGWLVPVPEHSEERIAAWAANGGEKFKAALAEGIQATIEMLRLDLLAEPAQPDWHEGQEIEAFSLVGLARGKVLSRNGARVIVRYGEGDLVSMPSTLPSAGPPRAELFTTCGSPYELTQDCSWFSGATRSLDLGGIHLRVAGSEKGDVVLLSSGERLLALQAVLETLAAAGIAVEGLRAMGDNGLFLELDGDGYGVLKGYTVE